MQKNWEWDEPVQGYIAFTDLDKNFRQTTKEYDLGDIKRPYMGVDRLLIRVKKSVYI